jgi:hypothetical protein
MTKSLKISAKTLKSFLTHVQGPDSAAIADVAVNITSGGLASYMRDDAGFRQVKVSYDFPAPVEGVEDFTLNIAKVKDFKKILDRFGSDDVTIAIDDQGKIAIASGRKRCAVSALDPHFIKNGMAKEFIHPHSLDVTAEQMEELLGDMKLAGNEATIRLSQKDGKTNIHIWSDDKMATFDHDYDAPNTEEFKVTLRYHMFSIFSIAEGTVNFKLDTDKPIMASYTTSEGFEVEHLLAPFIELTQQ